MYVVLPLMLSKKITKIYIYIYIYIIEICVRRERNKERESILGSPPPLSLFSFWIFSYFNSIIKKDYLLIYCESVLFSNIYIYIVDTLSTTFVLYMFLEITARKRVSFSVFWRNKHHQAQSHPEGFGGFLDP